MWSFVAYFSLIELSVYGGSNVYNSTNDIMMLMT